MRTALPIVVVISVLSACGSSGPAADTVATPVVETGTINYAEGALEPTGRSSSAGDADTGDGTVGSDPAADADGDTPASTIGDGTADGSTPDDGTESSTVTTASTAPPGTTGTTAPPGTSGTTVTTTGSAATTAPANGSTLAVKEGIVRIGDVSYPFVADPCDVDDSGFVVFGTGTSSEGDDVEVDIAGETVDLDGDGTTDLAFDIYVAYDLAPGVDPFSVPDFFASKLKTADFDEGAAIVVTVTGASVEGSGPIEDFNEVAVPEGSTLPMTFEVRCG